MPGARGRTLPPDLADELADLALPLDDAGLAAWRPALRGVRVLGVGAAAAGARELLELGGRLVEYAVDELGVRVVALAVSEAGGLGLDAAVRGVGSPGDAVAALGARAHDTREVVDVIARLRDRNELLAPEDRIRVVGTDPVHAARSVRALGAYLRSHAPDLLPAAREGLADLLDRDPGAKPLPTRVRDTVVGLYEEVAAGEAHLTAETTPAGYAEARRHAWVLARAAEVACAPRGREPSSAAAAEELPPTSAPVLRARLSAQAVTAALDEVTDGGAVGTSSGLAVLFWGHDDDVRVGDPTTAGRHVRAALGDAYYAVGGLFSQGAVTAARRGVLGRHARATTHRLPFLPGTVEADLADALGDADDHLLDLRGAGDGAGEDTALVAEWAATPTTTRRTGPVLDSGQLRARTPVVPAREYDALAHVPAVHPAWLR